MLPHLSLWRRIDSQMELGAIRGSQLLGQFSPYSICQKFLNQEPRSG